MSFLHNGVRALNQELYMLFGKQWIHAAEPVKFPSTKQLTATLIPMLPG